MGLILKVQELAQHLCEVELEVSRELSKLEDKFNARLVETHRQLRVLVELHAGKLVVIEESLGLVRPEPEEVMAPTQQEKAIQAMEVAAAAAHEIRDEAMLELMRLLKPFHRDGELTGAATLRRIIDQNGRLSRLNTEVLDAGEMLDDLAIPAGTLAGRIDFACTKKFNEGHDAGFAAGRKAPQRAVRRGKGSARKARR